MTKLADCVFDVTFSNNQEEEKFLADLAMELISDHTECFIDEVISVQNHIIKLKSSRTGLFYFVRIYKVVEHKDNGHYSYRELTFDFNMLLTKRLKFKLSNFYHYYSRRYDIGHFCELISKISFSDNQQMFRFRLIGVDDHRTKFIIEDNQLIQNNYYDIELLSTQTLTFQEFEILFKCSILHEHANDIVLEHIPDYFGPQQKMPSNEELIATLTLIDMLMFTQGLAGVDYLA